MSNYTAAEYALILDPERKVEGWWTLIRYGLKTRWQYTGPPDLHTARSEAWRGQLWLSALSYGWMRNYGVTQVFKANGKPENDTLLEENTDHAAAIAEAVRRVHHGE